MFLNIGEASGVIDSERIFLIVNELLQFPQCMPLSSFQERIQAMPDILGQVFGCDKLNGVLD